MSNLGIRLKQARKAAGLSLRALGDLVNLSHAAIKKYEDGVVQPSSDMLAKLAKTLKVPADLFFRPIKASLENFQFRQRRNLNEKTEEAIKFEVIRQLEHRLEVENLYPAFPAPKFSIPPAIPQKINNFGVLESIAEKLRAHWKLGLAPIHNLIDVFERQGIRVAIINHEDDHFEGLSALIKQQPILVINANWSGDHQRFNLMRELAHYILIDRLAPHLNEEQACQRFAGAFLLPRELVFQTVGKERHAIEWQELTLLKEQFHISVRAICFRLKELGVIQESYFEGLEHRYKEKGWHRKEPGVEIPPEKAHTFNQMVYHALAEEYIGESKAAELLACSLTPLKAQRKLRTKLKRSSS